MNKKIKYSIFNIETILILIIATCIVFLNAFTSNKLTELERAGDESMFIMDELTYPESNKLREEIIKYRPDSCKMIEMYNSNFELLLSLQFDRATPILEGSINDYPELSKILREDKEGQTTITIGEYKENIYFQWVTNDYGEERLIMVYSHIKEVEGLWVFKLVCYMILILIFILLIRLHLKEYQNIIDRYKLSSKHVIDEVNRK